MAQSVAIDVQINTLNASSNLKELKKNIADARNELASLEEGSAEFTRLSGAIAGANKKVQDLNEAIGLQTGVGKFQAVAEVGSKIAAGFEVAQGAMALFGSESKAVEEALTKVQGAMALAQGAKELAGLGEAFNNLKTVASSALNAIKTGIGATGIGLLVIALGAVVAYWDDIKEAISGVSDEQEQLNIQVAKNVAYAKENLDATTRTENSLKLQGKSEKEILQIKILQTDEIIKQTELQLQQQIRTIKAQMEAEKRNKEILEGIIKFISPPLTLILKTVDQVGELLGKDWGLEKKFFGSIAETIFSPSEVAAEGIKTIKETEKQLDELKNSRAGFQLKIKEIDAQSAKDAKAKKEKELEDQKKHNEEMLAGIEKNRLEEIQNLENQRKDLENYNQLTYQKKVEFENAIYKLETKKRGLTYEELEKLRVEHEAKLIGYDKEEKDRIEKHNQEMLDGIKKDQADQLSEYDTRIKEQQRLGKISDSLELEAAKYKLDTIKNDKNKHYEEILAAQEEYNAKVAEIDERERKRKEAATQATLNITKDGLKATADLVNAFAGQSVEAQKKAFEFQKGVNIATAIIDTYQSAVAAYKSALATPIVGTYLAPVAAAVAVAAGIANIRKIEQTKFDSKESPTGGGGGMQSGNFTPSLSAPVGNTATNLASIGYGENKPEPVKVYVTETDITSVQDQVQKIESKASIE